MVSMSHQPHNSDTNIGSITDDLVLDFLPAFQTLLNQDLRTERQRLGSQVSELLFIVGET